MQLTYLTECFPDQFQGSEHPVLAIMLDKTTTYRQLREAIIKENDCMSDCGAYPNDLAIEKMADKLLERVWSGAIADTSMDSIIDDQLLDDEHGESIYMYLAITASN